MKLISEVIAELKNSTTIKDLFDQYDVDINELDFIPICFSPLDVSARTDHGIIYLNEDMRNKPNDISHYLAHEVTHFLQQTTGDGPTEGSTDDTYLDNEFEQEGFQMQTKYLSETRDNDVAENYIEKVLDHHDVPNEERKDRKKELLELAASRWLGQFRVVAKAASQSFFSTQSLYKTATPGDETWNQQEGKTFWGKQGAGLLLICLEDQTALLLQRSQRVEEPGTWGIAGGAIGSEEESVTGAIREAKEELGSLPNLDQLLDTVTFTQGNFKYDTLIYSVSAAEKKKWTPTIKLNWENDQYRWFPLDALPSNLHFGVEYVKKTYKERGIEVFEDVQNEFDWIRAAFRKAFYAGRVDKSVVDDIAAATASGDKQAVSDALGRAGKWFVSNKDMAGLRETNQMKRLLGRSGGQNDWEKPKHEKSQYERYLYHGTDAGDALSILKNNTFIKGSAFDRVSFTSDLGIAFKFGDVVFVFDGKKVQRAGAKKMRYYDIDTLSKFQVQDPKAHNEDSKNPKISDIYSPEKEWAIPLPWTFDNDMLDHIIVASTARYSATGRQKAEKIKSILETVTDKPIRIQSPVSYGYNPSDSDISKLQVSDAKYAIFNYIAKPMNEFIELGYKYVEEEKKRLKAKYPNDSDEMIMYTLKNYSLYPFINSVYREKQELEDTFKNVSRYDARKIMNLKNNLARPLENIQADSDKSPIVAKMAETLAQLINGVDVVVDAMAKTYLKTEDDYKAMLTGYRASEDRPYFKRFQEWLAANPAQLEDYVASNNEIDESKYTKTSNSIQEFLNDMDDPAMIPDSVWMKFPLTLMDSRNVSKIPDERLRRILVGNPLLNKRFGDKGARWWIDEHRIKDYSQEKTRSYWERMKNILDPQASIPQPEPQTPNTEPEQE